MQNRSNSELCSPSKDWTEEYASRVSTSPPKADSGSCLNWLFVDLNSYFASVEQEVRPDLRGRPVGVVPMMADTTCCIAASYEAKAYGVKTGTIVADAKRMCPDIVLHQKWKKICGNIGGPELDLPLVVTCNRTCTTERHIVFTPPTPGDPTGGTSCASGETTCTPWICPPCD